MGRSGDVMTGGVGPTKHSSSIELSGDHGVVYCVSDHLRRRRYFYAAVRAAFGRANRPLDVGVEERDRRASNFRRDLCFDFDIDHLLLAPFCRYKRDWNNR
jgi:hypothetical protein